MRTLKRLIILIGFLTIIAMIFDVYGVTSITTSSNTVNPGDTVSVNINVSSVATWQLNVTYSNLQLVSGATTLVRSDNGIENVSRTAGTLTFKALSTGTATISVSGNSYTEAGEASSSNAVKTINVVATPPPAPPPTVTPPASTSPIQTTSPPKVNTTTTTKSDTTTKTNNTTNTVLSNNAYLKEFRVNLPGMTPDFAKTTYNYLLNVDSTIQTLDVTAIPDDDKASVTVSGNTDLKDGENVIRVEVVAEDKNTINTYQIMVTKTDNVMASTAYLTSLIITNGDLSPIFEKEILNYTCDIQDKNIDKLDIMAFPENEKASVTIEGNENLKKGENIVRVKVTSENNENEKIYTITANIGGIINKGKIKNKEEKESLLWMIVKENIVIISLYFFVWLEVLQVVYLYEKYVIPDKKSKKSKSIDGNKKE